MSGAATIKVKALALIRRGDELLVGLSRDVSRNETYARFLGGGVEFGEASKDAIIREIREEVGAEITVGALLGWIENTFVLEGQAAHELVAIYEAEFDDRALYERETFEMLDPEEAGWVGGVAWRSPAALAAARTNLYPIGIDRILATLNKPVG